MALDGDGSRDHQLHTWINKVDSRLMNIETILEERLGGYPELAKLVIQTCKDVEHQDKRINNLEDDRTWMNRKIIAAFLAALVALLVAYRGGV